MLACITLCSRRHQTIETDNDTRVAPDYFNCQGKAASEKTIAMALLSHCIIILHFTIQMSFWNHS